MMDAKDNADVAACNEDGKPDGSENNNNDNANNSNDNTNNNNNNNSSSSSSSRDNPRSSNDSEHITNTTDQKEDALRQHILRLALSNAVAYNGHTDSKKILGKILGTRPDLRTFIQTVSKMVSEVTLQVNSMSAQEQHEQLGKIASSSSSSNDAPSHIHKEKTAAKKSNNYKDEPGAWLPPLEGAQYGSVITRFPPEPNGYPHIGHAKAVIINRDYAAKYGGRCILRIDDTNPDAERKEYLAGINVGLEWLGLEFKKEDIIHTSDDMEALYQKGEELIRSGRAYVCTCKKDDIGKNRRERVECKCRKKNDTDEHYKRWGKMHAAKLKAGEAVVRFRGDMKADNAVMRDPILFRIISTPHYRQGTKYRVWPSYDMSVAIEDSIHNITHAFRSKEFETRAELISAILDALNMRKPRQHYFARLAFDGMPTSKRIIKPLMEDGRILGYDDPRIPTLGGLKRRGIKPEAVRKFIESLGMTKADTVAPFETLESINRNLIDSRSTRLFMVKGAMRIIINDPDGKMPEQIEMPNHPLQQSMGKRAVPVSRDMYMPGSDFEKLKVGSIIKLLGLGYVRISDMDVEDTHHKINNQRYFAQDKDKIKQRVAAHADYITGTSKTFSARDALGFYQKNGIDISPDIRSYLETRCNLEKGVENNGDDVQNSVQDANDDCKKPPLGKKREIKEDAKMQWVSLDTAATIRLAIPQKPFDENDEFDNDSLEEIEVYTEPHFHQIREGEEIQFVRFGYCRKDTGRRVIFTHD